MLALKHECYYRELVELLEEVRTPKEVEELEHIAIEEFKCHGEELWIDRFHYRAMMKRVEIEQEEDDEKDFRG